MPERLQVQNFGGMKSVDIDIGDIHILIGPQASGKSICAKLLYSFRSIPEEILMIVERAENGDSLQRRLENRFSRFFPSSSWPKSSFLIRHQAGEASASVEFDGSTGRPQVRVQTSSHYPSLLERCREHRESSMKNRRPDEHSEDPLAWLLRMSAWKKKFYNDLHAEISETVGVEQIFIPAGRSFFAVLQNMIFAVLERLNNLDLFLARFGGHYQSERMEPGFAEGLPGWLRPDPGTSATKP